ncbi:hypothetical protein Tco_1248886 [Tanacetum coccineum]
MVINSPCLTDKKELAIPWQTTTGKELSNLLMHGSLPKTISTKVAVLCAKKPWGGALTQTRSERVLEKPNELPLPKGHTSGSGEGIMEYTFELMDTVLDLEKEKDPQAVKILKLKQRVKKLERKRKSSISHLRRRIYRQVKSSDDDLDEEDASK